MRRSLATAGVAVVLLPLTLGGAALPALAAADSGDVAVSNTETVQAKLDATGKLVEARVYEQLALSGHGTTTIHNPVSTKGLRNLDGFGAYKVVDGEVVSQVTVDGQKRQRSVSDYDQDLPLTVKVEYTLDGEPVEASHVVGKTGTLGVHYTVKNVTGKTQDVTYDDGTGNEATASAQTVVPMIGQLVTTLPATFTDVQSDEAGMAGDGHGGTRLTFQMTLFPPIGSDTAEFGYTAHVAPGRVPTANLTSMAVSPLDYPSFKGGAASYKSGAESGVKITGAGLQLDDGVLQLHDGAAQLLAGLLQLHEGAAKLSAGLNNDAAPGAGQLADGAHQLDDGLAKARASAPALLDGLNQVDGGLAAVDAGLVTMYAKVGALPAAAEELHVGIGKLQAAIGSTTTDKTLLYGVDQVRLGVASAASSSAQVSAGAVTLGNKLTTAITGLQSLSGAMNPLYQPTYDATLKAMADAMPTLTNTTSPLTIAGGANAIAVGLSTSAVPGLMRVECGLSNTSLPVCDPKTPGLLQYLGDVDAGVSKLVTTVVKSVQGGIGDADDTKADNTLRGGIHSLQGGTDQLSAGGGALVSGLRDLGDGAGRLSDGADTLADGLQDAADGSTQLADGLGDASTGAPALVDGTQQLSDDGTTVLTANGKETSADYGVKYAVLAAGAERAANESMAYGAPVGAAGATAYSIDIAGADGSGVNTLARLIFVIVLFAAGIGIATLVSRRTA